MERLVKAQHGVIRREQALVAGLTESEIDGLVRSGKWKSVHREVYLVGTDEGWLSKLSAAVHRCAGVAGYRSSAGVWMMDGFDKGVDCLDVITCRSLSLDKVNVHRVKRLDPKWLRTRNGILVTSPVKTLLDLGSVVHLDHVEGAMDHCLRKGWTTWKELEAVAAAAPKRGSAGAATLREILRLREGQKVHTDSLLETRFNQLVRYGGLPTPTLQRKVLDSRGNSRRLDFRWPNTPIVAETAG